MTKKIVIDARLYGPTKTGIGRYTQNLLLALKKLPDFKKYDFHLIVNTADLSPIKKGLGKSFTYHPTNISHYSLLEQLVLPQFISQLKPDLVHFTHFNKPVLYSKTSVITIHDLIKHFYKGKETTTKNPFFYWPKYLIYRLITEINIKKNYLIVPSNYWRNILINRFGVHPRKITTIYEAVDPKFLPIHKSSVNKPACRQAGPKSYILYTGNLYPHKNIGVLFQALKEFPDLKLKIICARSIFSKQAETLAQKIGILSQVEFLGFVNDADFPQLYSHALCLVHPSFMEGFSLTGLEAMSLNCPVIAANSSCLPEVYGNSVLYFNPKSTTDLVNQINRLRSDQKLRSQLIELGHLQLKKYSWEKTATVTLNVYEKILNKS